MRNWIVGLFLIALTIGPSLTASAMPTPVQAPSKSEMIQRLKSLKEKQASELTSLETAIRQQLQDSMTLNVANEDTRYASARTGMLANKVDELNKRRMELNARREIIDRLIFAIDSKYSNQPLQPFLEQQFLEMASNDLADGRDSRMWKAYTYLSIAIREVPEPREDMFAVIEGFMNFSNILDPKTPAEFLASRNYTNGSQSVAAKAVPREDAGNLDSKILNSTSTGINPVALELRMTMPKPVQQAAAGKTDETLSGSTRSADEDAKSKTVTN